MARAYKPKTSLKSLAPSPLENPLIESMGIKTRQRQVRTRTGRELLDPETGEVGAVAVVQIVEERDEAEFVKVFAEGVRAAFDLSRTGYRVFHAVLDVYQRTAMRGGFAEAVELFWFGEGLAGRDIGMTEDTFKKGLRELLDKEFLALRHGNSFWVNPALFFKGNRVAFIREYRRRTTVAFESDTDTPPIEQRSKG